MMFLLNVDFPPSRQSHYVRTRKSEGWHEIIYRTHQGRKKLIEFTFSNREAKKRNARLSQIERDFLFIPSESVYSINEIAC